MPRRKQTGRQKRISDQVIEELLDLVHAGVPWIWHSNRQDQRGRCDLLKLVTGAAYFPDFLVDENDTETATLLWGALREDILAEHIKRRPGTRPWAWWHLDDRDPRRVIRVDPDYIACDGGRIYETQRQYLNRLHLLTAEERAVFRKYGDVVVVHISQGEFGKCAPCWEQAHEIATDVDFDLKRAAMPVHAFWIPEELFFDCEHHPGMGAAIFREYY